MKQGAADYLLEDRLARLGPAVTQAFHAKRLREARQRAKAQDEVIGALAGGRPAGADFFFDKSTELDQVAGALGELARRGAANQG